MVTTHQREFAKELALRTSITLTKWVNRIHLAKVVCEPVDQRIGIKPCEQSLGSESRKGLIEHWFDKLLASKQALFFTDVHRPQTARPIVDISEQMSMDRTKVCGIKSSNNRPVF